MDWIDQVYGVAYAPNTRETIRRFTLHQFVDATLVEQNPDNPGRPINSPKWSYRVHPTALKVIRLADGPGLDIALESYLQKVPGLIAQYSAARSLRRVPITLPDGRALSLSPGGQNLLIKRMIDDFCAYHTPGGHVLYVGDADAKWAVFEAAALSSLGVAVDRHGKMPDLVVYWPEKN